MSPPQPLRPPELPVADLYVDPVDVTPGYPVRVPVGLTNRLPVSASFTVNVVGVEPQWVAAPALIGPVAPGQYVVAELVLSLPIGHPASELAAAVQARAVEQPGLPPARRPAQTDLRVGIGDGSLIGASLEPSDVRGGSKGKFELILFNRARAPMRVDLSASAPERHVRVRFQRRTEVLGPGQEGRGPASGCRSPCGSRGGRPRSAWRGPSPNGPCSAVG